MSAKHSWEEWGESHFHSLRMSLYYNYYKEKGNFMAHNLNRSPYLVLKLDGGPDNATFPSRVRLKRSIEPQRLETL